ncbi:ribonuclease P protein subunit p25-like protein [Scaptodrosophila lebanonensis]|uniref:Ribonuclease P protein subunit p25-like protein n=1 Tax=Drosophila lebanonensis TaxID=7225 RepID=A0A6J2UFK1_DROLE|nr:ribonuclease P protein subunit p25-like protein [Scaptodrosophila lebanonensis]
MMHYRKAENVEQELSKNDLPFEDCMPKTQKDFLWMHVKGGTKVSNVISYAEAALNKGEYRTVVWSGSGGGVVKTISCAEILKRSHELYQVTRMGSTSVEEHWKPQMDGLEEIIVRREIPTLHILMSLDELDKSIAGLQRPNTSSDFWVDDAAPMQQQQQQQQQQHSEAGGSNQQSNKRPRSGRYQKNNTNKPQQHRQLPNDVDMTSGHG